jgi:hypothetical protein
MLGGELESDFLGIPNSPLSLPVPVNNLAIVSIGISLPGQHVKHNRRSFSISEVEPGGFVVLKIFGLDVNGRL